MKDQEIIALLQNPVTQRKGFESMVRQYSETLYWQIRHIVVSHDNANDVLQNTFIKAWNNLGQFEARSSLSTWLHRIAINEALDYLRKEKIRETTSTDDDSGLANHLMADEYFDGDETQAELQEAISKLPDVQRTVFNLRYYQEMKYSEMSKLLDTSEGALKASYHQAVKKISEYFHRHD